MSALARAASLVLLARGALSAAVAYTPDALVTSLSKRRHPGYSGAGFDSSYLKAGGADDYPRSLAALSAIAISGGFLAILAYCAILCARRSVWKDKEFSRFSIGFTLDTDTYRLRSKGSRPVRFVIIVGFVVSVVLVLGCVGGKALVSPAVTTMRDSVSRVAVGVAMPVELPYTTITAANAAAPQPGALQQCAATKGNTAALMAAVAGVRAQVGTAGTLLTSLAKRVQNDGTRFISIAATMLIVLVLVPALVGVAAAATSRSDWMLGASGGGIAVLSFLVVAIGMFLSLSVGMADYCLAPDANGGAALVNMGKPAEKAVYDYYTTCPGGASPFATSVGALRGAWAATAAQGAGCAAQKAEFDKITALVAAAVTAAARPCAPEQAAYVAAVHKALCVDTVAGLYRLWMAMATTAGVFLTTLVFAAFVNLDKTDAELEEEDDTPTARSRRRRRLKEKRRRSRERKRSHVREKLIGGGGGGARSDGGGGGGDGGGGGVAHRRSTKDASAVARSEARHAEEVV